MLYLATNAILICSTHQVPPAQAVILTALTICRAIFSPCVKGLPYSMCADLHSSDEQDLKCKVHHPLHAEDNADL
jgi:hypothetical protein